MFKKKLIVKDINIFYKRLWLYKSFLFRKTYFETDILRIRNMIEALNIKNRKKRIAYIYDQACIEVDNYWKDKNPCCFKNNKCLSQQKPGCKYKNGCCRRCVYQSSNGCITSNLTCKFFYCTCVSSKYDLLTIKDIKVLKLLTFRQRTILKHAFFSSREEVLGDLYIGSVFIFIIRLLFRYLVKNIV